VGLIIQGDDEDNELSVKVVREAAGNLTLYNIIHGAGGNDRLYGYSDSIPSGFSHGAELYGEAGNDTLVGTGLTDTLSGGDGEDVIHFYSDDADIIDGGDGYDSLLLTDSNTRLGTAKFTSIEEIVISSGDTYVESADLSGVQVIRASSARYTNGLIFWSAANLTDVAILGPGRFRLLGSGKDDVLDVQKSNTHVNAEGARGDDIIRTGSADDTLRGAEGNDFLDGGADRDILYGSVGDDTLYGGDGDDLIFTSGGDDRAYGGDGNDILSGTEMQRNAWVLSKHDHKIVSGGAGDDIFRGFKTDASTNIRFLGGEGEDELVLAGGDLSNVTVKDIEIARITGADSITGDADLFDSFDQIVVGAKKMQFVLSSGGHFAWRAASDEPEIGSIIGSSGADQIDMRESQASWAILGGAGNDVLTAGHGYNAFVGQAGRDKFVFHEGTGTTAIWQYDSAGADRDIIDLSNVRAIKNFDDMMDHHVTKTNDGEFLVIRFNKTLIGIQGADAGDLDASGFLF
jgi:serralysin